MDAEGIFAAAIAKHRAGILEDAAAGYRRVIALRPDDAAPLINLGLACLDLGRWDEAVDVYSRVLARGPASPQSYNNLGNALGRLGRLRAAMEAWRAAIALAPSEPEPYGNQAAALLETRQFAVAVAACRRALALCPDNPAVENTLGSALAELGDEAGALAAFLHALASQPERVETAINLAGLLNDRGDSGSAADLGRRAICLSPDESRAYNNLGNALKAEGRLEAALTCFRRALVLAPDDAEVRFNSASVLLKQGHLLAGWQAFESRKQTPRSAFRRLDFDRPEWDGSRLAGRTLLLHAEQGLGDVLQFVRYAPLIKRQSEGRIVLRVYPGLVRLLCSVDGVDAVCSTEDPLPPYDCHLSLMSAPWMMKTDLSGIPNAVPYCRPERGDVMAWRKRLAGLTGRKIGLVWAGAPRENERTANWLDRRRSMRLAAFAPLVEIPGIDWISLQKGAAAAQATRPPQGMRLHLYGDLLDDFADTAGLVDNLDLVISVDTSTAHLAGALGKPVWIFSRFDGCWRWLEDRADSPWYPTARLFRQRLPGDWGAPMAEAASALRRWMSSPGTEA